MAPSRSSFSQHVALQLLLTLATQVWVTSSTLTNSVSSITPASITVNQATVITFGTGAAGDVFAFAASGTNCNSVTPNIAVDGSSQATVTVASVQSNMVLCYRDNGQTDSVAQSANSITLTVIATTSLTKFTAVSPAGIYAGVATAVRLYGTAASGDKAIFAPDCSAATPNVLLTGGLDQLTTFTMGSSGSGFRLCIRQAGGSDSVAQDNIWMSVSAIGGNAADPVSWYGDKVHVFSLPPKTLKPLLTATDMTLWGETFAYGGDWQQWFDRMVLASPDGNRWVQIAMKKNILDFNRSKAPKGHFETMTVTLGHGPIDNPTMTSEVLGPDFQHIPLNFLGFDVVFWKMNRNARAANTMIGAAHRECMEVAGANIHFYVCSAPAHEFYGWQRDLSITNAHLDLAIIEVLHSENLKGILPELWGMQPMSAEVESYIIKDKDVADASKLPALPEGSSPNGKGWAGGFGFKDLEKSCKQGDHTVLACDENSTKNNQTILTV